MVEKSSSERQLCTQGGGGGKEALDPCKERVRERVATARYMLAEPRSGATSPFDALFLPSPSCPLLFTLREAFKKSKSGWLVRGDRGPGQQSQGQHWAERRRGGGGFAGALSYLGGNRRSTSPTWATHLLRPYGISDRPRKKKLLSARRKRENITITKEQQSIFYLRFSPISKFAGSVPGPG